MNNRFACPASSTKRVNTKDLNPTGARTHPDDKSGRAKSIVHQKCDIGLFKATFASTVQTIYLHTLIPTDFRKHRKKKENQFHKIKV